jgi:hypothetical protein
MINKKKKDWRHGSSGRVLSSNSSYPTKRKEKDEKISIYLIYKELPNQFKTFNRKKCVKDLNSLCREK